MSDGENTRKPRHGLKKAKGNWPSKGDLDSSLVGLQAWSHPAVLEWRRRVREEYSVKSDVLLLTPCSNVKPYPLSPTSRRIRSILRDAGYWDDSGRGVSGSPRGLEWAYLSDLLVLVPYESAHTYPACCYDFPPRMLSLVGGDGISEIRRTLQGFFDRNSIETLILYLPRFYRELVKPVIEGIGKRVRVVDVGYHLFYGPRALREALMGVKS